MVPFIRRKSPVRQRRSVMSKTSGTLLSVLAIAEILLFCLVPALAQSRPSSRSRILQAIDDTHSTTLSGNTHPLARAEFDQGALSDAAPLRRMVLLLQRSPEQE